jgi:hypothetical protein
MVQRELIVEVRKCPGFQHFVMLNL